MERIYYKPSKFMLRGEKFETPSGLGGTFDIKFVKKDADGKYHFFRKKRGGWPAASYTFTEEQLKTEVFLTILDKYERLVLTAESCKKYEQLLADPHIDRVVKL